MLSRKKMTDFTADGHIVTTNVRKGQARRYTYGPCGKSLVDKGQEIKNLTKC